MNVAPPPLVMLTKWANSSSFAVGEKLPVVLSSLTCQVPLPLITVILNTFVSICGMCLGWFSP